LDVDAPLSRVLRVLGAWYLCASVGHDVVLGGVPAGRFRGPLGTARSLGSSVPPCRPHAREAIAEQGFALGPTTFRRAAGDFRPDFPGSLKDPGVL